MLKFKFYPKRLSILASVVLFIALLPLIAKVLDIHLPTGEEINLMQKTDYTISIDEEADRPRSEENQLTEEEIEFHEERSVGPIYNLTEEE